MEGTILPTQDVGSQRVCDCCCPANKSAGVVGWRQADNPIGRGQAFVLTAAMAQPAAGLKSAAVCVTPIPTGNLSVAGNIRALVSR